MDYITPQDAARKWNLSLRRVQFFCSKNMIPGTIRMGRQWLIPQDAEKPIDGRTKRGRQVENTAPYRFPILALSRYYASRAELSEDEKILLDAQILICKAEYLESVKTCRTLLSQCPTPWLKFGIYATLAYNYLLLGQINELRSCEDEMHAIIKEDSTHEEDYRLILAAIKFTCTFKSSDLLNIHVSKISNEALIFFECAMLEAGVFSNERETLNCAKLYESISRRFELLGILPALMISHSVIAFFYTRENNRNEAQWHIAEVCKIGYKQNFNMLLAKLGVFSPADYDCALEKLSIHRAKRVSKLRHANLQNWKVIFAKTRDTALHGAPEEYLEDSGVLFLVGYGMTNEEIATLKNVPKPQINATVKKLCKLYNCASKAELAEFAQKTYMPKE